MWAPGQFQEQPYLPVSATGFTGHLGTREMAGQEGQWEALGASLDLKVKWPESYILPTLAHSYQEDGPHRATGQKAAS